MGGRLQTESLVAFPAERWSPSNGIRTPLAFTELVLALAAKDGHQPSLLLSGGSVECRLTTEECGGISTRDFELARKISVLG
jgi:pterin-4a-carbinolamine dehydratase